MEAAASGARQRLFFALWPGVRAQAALARLAREVALHAQGRAPPERNLHLTLAFLGMVDGPRLRAVIDAGASAAASVAPFRLELERLGGGSYAVAWLAPDNVPAPLCALHVALNEALASRGFPVERRMFRPHITLARDCTRRSLRGALPAIGWTVDHMALVSSTPAPGGSIYTDVERWELGPRTPSSGVS